jgi:flagellar biosynthesis regulator FlbT
MSRRIEIELTSARPDGTWTWRAAGAQKPKGVLDGALLPADAAVGLILKADAETELDGVTILSVNTTKAKVEKSGLIELITSDKPFEAVTQQLARRERSDRGDRDRGDRGDRRDRGPRREGDNRGPGSGPRRDKPAGDGADRRDRAPGSGPRREGDNRERGPRREGGSQRPRFEAPPELPQRPKAKRLKTGRAHRNAVLADLSEAQKAVAERALLGGLPAVRQAVNEQNTRLKAEGKEEIPAAGLLAIAEQLLPRLRVAEWLDRADAALADVEELDLRDLRSVVAASDDPMVARDESTREVAARLKEALVTKQEKELALWFEDIDAAVGVGRVVRALKLSSQPPKAGVRFPAESAAKLANAANASLTADALPDRWVAVLEAVAFSPVRSLVQPAAKPTQINDELLATVKRLGALLPAVAALFGIEVDAKAQPKPLRPTRPAAPAKGKPAPKPPAAPKAAAPATPAPAVQAAAVEAPEAAVEAAEVVEAPVVEAPAVVEAPVAEVAEAPAVEAPAVVVEVAAATAPAVDEFDSADAFSPEG